MTVPFILSHGHSGLSFVIAIINNLSYYFHHHCCLLFSLKSAFFHSIHSLNLSHTPKINPTSISSNSSNGHLIKDHGFLSHITTITYFRLKSKIYSKKVIVMKNYTLPQATRLFNTYTFRDINYIIISFFYLHSGF